LKKNGFRPSQSTSSITSLVPELSSPSPSSSVSKSSPAPSSSSPASSSSKRNSSTSSSSSKSKSKSKSKSSSSPSSSPSSHPTKRKEEDEEIVADQLALRRRYESQLAQEISDSDDEEQEVEEKVREGHIISLVLLLLAPLLHLLSLQSSSSSSHFISLLIDTQFLVISFSIHKKKDVDSDEEFFTKHNSKSTPPTPGSGSSKGYSLPPSLLLLPLLVLCLVFVFTISSLSPSCSAFLFFSSLLVSSHSLHSSSGSSKGSFLSRAKKNIAERVATSGIGKAIMSSALDDDGREMVFSMKRLLALFHGSQEADNAGKEEEEENEEEDRSFFLSSYFSLSLSLSLSLFHASERNATKLGIKYYFLYERGLLVPPGSSDLEKKKVIGKLADPLKDAAKSLFSLHVNCKGWLDPSVLSFFLVTPFLQPSPLLSYPSSSSSPVWSSSSSSSPPFFFSASLHLFHPLLLFCLFLYRDKDASSSYNYLPKEGRTSG
jgi:hypothetical protein